MIFYLYCGRCLCGFLTATMSAGDYIASLRERFGALIADVESRHFQCALNAVHRLRSKRLSSA